MNTVIKNEMTRFPKNFNPIWEKIGVVSGFILGLILLAAGIFLSIFAFFARLNFDNIELILIITSFVFFGLGAHCMDLSDKEKKSKRG